MDEQKRVQAAQRDLEIYREKMVELWGATYRSHPAYEEVVREVARGRYPHYALFDRLGL